MINFIVAPAALLGGLGRLIHNLVLNTDQISGVFFFGLIFFLRSVSLFTLIISYLKMTGH